MNTPRWADTNAPAYTKVSQCTKWRRAGRELICIDYLTSLLPSLPPSSSTLMIGWYADDCFGRFSVFIHRAGVVGALSVIYMLCLCSQYISCAPEFVDAVLGVDPRGRTLCTTLKMCAPYVSTWLRCQPVLQVDTRDDKSLARRHAKLFRLCNRPTPPNLAPPTPAPERRRPAQSLPILDVVLDPPLPLCAAQLQERVGRHR
ncbi:hypothetical protein DFH08DRAFT_60191 [Mycena albidolilacea]|uniref:Uncharacterized protein n=1 Tax=Mycena albidolilacea TaxID=1033008 RepID=A0AAD7AAY0_9AGAR|nr:hypothetical protein DFH08DRAFT_60191 [Mycena albidolilacea]